MHKFLSVAQTWYMKRKMEQYQIAINSIRHEIADLRSEENELKTGISILKHKIALFKAKPTVNTKR